MLKRLVAFLFIFTVAGQVYAGVCNCFDGNRQPQHSCCKRQKGERDSISTKGCCDTNCATQQYDTVVQVRTEPTAKIKFEPIIFSDHRPAHVFVTVIRDGFVPKPPFADHRLKYSRPPELYLRHHALLI